MSEEIVCVDDFEKYALNDLDKKIADYYKSGANLEQTLAENRKGFSRLRFRTRCLRDVSNRKFNTKILGKEVSFPVGIAPCAMQRMAHPDGEEATVRGAAAEGCIMILSTLSTTSIEDVAKAAPKSQRWFQLYIYKDRNVTKNLVKRAEAAGFQALVLTVDTPLFGNRLADSRNKFSLPPHLRLANFSDADFSVMNTNESGGSNLNSYVNSLFDPSLTWDVIKWLKEVTTLPIIVKGVLTAEDAILAIDHGVSGIIVSNHGARQLDGVPSTIEALPEVVRAVAGRCEVYMDGGVRTGTDVLKAVALGAKCVFIARPVLWGLAHSDRVTKPGQRDHGTNWKGENGVRKVLQILRDEFQLAMGLLGCASVDEVKSFMVVREEFYSRL